MGLYVCYFQHRVPFSSFMHLISACILYTDYQGRVHLTGRSAQYLFLVAGVDSALFVSRFHERQMLETPRGSGAMLPREIVDF